jgi:hypothetical protein
VWQVVRLFTDLAPYRPTFDTVNSDELAYYVATNPDSDPGLTGKRFSLDMMCSDANFAAYVNVVVVSAVALPGNLWEVTLSGPADVAVASASWNLITFTGQEFVLEPVPGVTPDTGFVASGSYFLVYVVAAPTNGPVGGAAKLQYICSFQPTCEWSPASDILVLIEEGSIASETGVAAERALERILARLAEVTPAHVELIPRFQSSINCSLSISCTVDSGLDVYASITAFLTTLYDAVPADATPTDSIIFVTVEVPT